MINSQEVFDILIETIIHKVDIDDSKTLSKKEYERFIQVFCDFVRVSGVWVPISEDDFKRDHPFGKVEVEPCKYKGRDFSEKDKLNTLQIINYFRRKEIK